MNDNFLDSRKVKTAARGSPTRQVDLNLVYQQRIDEQRSEIECGELVSVIECGGIISLVFKHYEEAKIKCQDVIVLKVVERLWCI